MKFKVRDGFVVRITTKIEIAEGKFELQENSYHGGQLCDLTAEQAGQHAHKLEPLAKDRDKASEDFLASKVLPSDAGAQLGITGEQQAFAKALAMEMVAAIAAVSKAQAEVQTSEQPQG